MGTRRLGYLVCWKAKDVFFTYIGKAEWFSSLAGANGWALQLIERGYSCVSIEKTDVPY
jgi:hypothetical protein